MGGTTGIVEALVPVYAAMRDWDGRFLLYLTPAPSPETGIGEITEEILEESWKL